MNACNFNDEITIQKFVELEKKRKERKQHANFQECDSSSSERSNSGSPTEAEKINAKAFEEDTDSSTEASEFSHDERRKTHNLTREKKKDTRSSFIHRLSMKLDEGLKKRNGSNLQVVILDEGLKNKSTSKLQDENIFNCLCCATKEDHKRRYMKVS